MGRIQENLVGRTFGQLLVVEAGRHTGKRLFWNCRCTCGGTKEAQTSHLKGGTVTSCGCLRGKPRENLLGQVFGQLTVVEAAEPVNGTTYWWCVCACGVHKQIGAGELKQGKTVSCGCQRGHARGAQLRTHGEGYGTNKTVEYGVWGKMHGRCEHPGNPNYKDYGGRGITVCTRWSGPQGYTNFLEDMGRRPSAAHSIERKDNNAGYSPENCIWATKLVQMANKRDNRRLTFNGETLHLAEWARRVGLKRTTLRARLDAGWALEDALRPL